MENYKGEDRQDIREADVRHRRKLQEGHDAKDVVGKNESEKREKEGHEAHELVADDLFTNIVSNEGVDRLARELKFAWNNQRFTRCGDEKCGNY